MRPTTKAGQELSRYGPAGLSWNELDDAIDAIEEQAAAQERERIRANIMAENWTLNWFERRLPDGSVEATLDTERFADSILAEPSDGPQYVEEVEDRYDR